jgi:hypothetical protein
MHVRRKFLTPTNTKIKKNKMYRVWRVSEKKDVVRQGG